jgi:hypothetical protein
VQALKSMGQEHVTPEVILSIREWLALNLRAHVTAPGGRAVLSRVSRLGVGTRTVAPPSWARFELLWPARRRRS